MHTGVIMKTALNQVRITNIKDARMELEERKQIFPTYIHKVVNTSDGITITSQSIKSHIQLLRGKYAGRQASNQQRYY